MRREVGFTLLEVMVAIVLSGVVALLVYGAIDAAVGTASRLQRSDAEMRTRRGWQVVLEDALRNVRSNADYGRPTLVLSSGRDPSGRPQDRLQFITAGGTPPLTPDADWLVTVESRDERLVLTAIPVGVTGPARVVEGPPGIAGADIRVFGGLDQVGWREEWSDRRLLPRAVEIVYWGAGAPPAPVLLALPAGAS